MKEKDIRERIQTFLKETVRYVVVPASMGIGLALVGGVGCGSGDESEDNGNGTVTMTSTTTATSTDTGGSVALYSAPMNTVTSTGTSTGSTEPVVKYMAVMPDAGMPQPEYAAPIPRDAAVYSAPMTDTQTKTGTGTGTGTGTASTSTGTGTGTSPVLLYMAPMPDAGATAKYAAPVPRDAGQAVTDYMAPQPLYAAPVTKVDTSTSTGTGSNPVLRYMAPMPTTTATATKTSGVVALYAAPVPDLTDGK